MSTLALLPHVSIVEYCVRKYSTDASPYLINDNFLASRCVNSGNVVIASPIQSHERLSADDLVVVRLGEIDIVKRFERKRAGVTYIADDTDVYKLRRGIDRIVKRVIWVCRGKPDHSLCGPPLIQQHVVMTLVLMAEGRANEIIQLAANF
jgi:hypothetical protein